MPNGRNAGRLFADCTNLYGHGEWHALRPLSRQWLRRLLGLHTTECIHCHRRFKQDELLGGYLGGEAKRRQPGAEDRREARRVPPRLPPR